MMPSGKLCSRQPKKNPKTIHYESRVQSNTRANFKLTYGENYGKLRGTSFFGGGGSILIASEEPHQSLSTAAYSVILL